MIDEKELIERFRQLKGCDSLANMFIKDVINEIKKQPKIGEWILCSERLPEKDGCYFATYTMPNGERICHELYFHGEYWGDEFSDEYANVIAWQPLPTTYLGDRI